MGLKVCITGCFDIFHEGHKKFIKAASKIAGNGQLYILINTDKSVRRLKGNTRPKDPFKQRMWNVLLASNKRVIIKKFDTEEELCEIYNIIKPDIIMHGNDITDITKVTSYPKWPILIYPRIMNKNGSDISTTRIIKKKETTEE